MINAVIKKRNKNYVSFTCKGHSGYASSGEDIVCSAVSMLTITILNSIEAFSNCAIETKDNDGYLECRFIDDTDEKAALLMDTMILGLKSIVDIYGNKYLTLKIEEV